MSREAMDVDQSQSQKVQSSIQALCAGPLASSVSNLSKYSHGIPSEKDYHFFYNFDEFRAPVQEIQKRSQSLLELVGTSANIWGKEMSLTEDLDDAYDWLVNVNDELLERLDGALDEFQTIRKKEEENGRASNLEEDGFQIVHGKKKKASKSRSSSDKGDVDNSSQGSSVKMAKKDAKMSGKPKVPFHIPTIPRPQEEFNILSNNLNQPFEHVWLQRSEDGLRFVHPLEQLSISDFVDKDVGVLQPVRPPPIECTPFKLVEKLKDLKELVAKLRDVNEFAVDLEHNQYRSFQGLTCLMQISTRSEDFVIDTLKLKVQIGPYLREIFKDPTKRKVMHGADRDIVWLQRDFGIYVCNLFDTGQASRVLKLERNSLEHLLHHFCEVSAKKEYQNADWRFRPLPEDMLRYAREDTHYLLYIYDLMRIKLFSMPKDSENADSPLAEVYKRSYDICTLLYEKELLTENSFLHIYGLQAAGLNSKQLAIVAGLYEWRDMVARAEDESTGYILPNKTLLEIAKQMPVSISKLRWLIKLKHPYVERNLASVVSIIRHSILNASAYEDVVKHLNEARIETGLQASEDTVAFNDGSESNIPGSKGEKEAEGDESQNSIGDGDKEKRCDNYVELTQPRQTISGLSKEAIASACTKHPVKIAEAHVPLLNKPNRGLGALLVNAAPKRKLDTNKVVKEEIKLEKIRSSVNLPFYSFSGRVERSEPVAESPASAATLEIQPPEESRIESPAPLAVPGGNPPVDEIINLDDSSEEEGSIERDGEGANEQKDNGSEVEEDEPMSLADLSSSFQKCLQTPNPKTKEVGGVEKPGGFVQVKPFDYEAARATVFFGEEGENTSGKLARNIQTAGKKKDSSQALDQKDGGTRELAQGKRRQAFPASGNRSGTFR